MADLKEGQQALFEGFDAVVAVQAKAPIPPARVKVKYALGKLYNVACSEINSLSGQPRKFFDEEGIVALAESIKRFGVVEPILCSVDDAGHLTLLAGERRLRAARLADLKSVPVRILDGDPKEISLVENLMRKDLSLVEEAESLASLKELRVWKLADLSKLTGKSEPTLCEILSVTKLPSQVLEKCRTAASVPRDVLVLISRLGTESEMIAAFEQYGNGTVTRPDLKKASKRFSHSEGTPATKLVSKFLKTLERIDAATLSEADRRSFRAEVEKLQGRITIILELL